MKKTIRIIMGIVLLVILGWALVKNWDSISERFDKTIKVGEEEQEENDLEEVIQETEQLFPQEIEKAAEGKTAQVEIEKNDCENECEGFSEGEDLEYCQQVCGFVPVELESDQDCEALSGNEADYCWRDQAVVEKNFKLCEKISDKNIFQQCNTRIWEDIVDESSITE